MTFVPDNTAVRTALWRALHLLVDAPPHVIEDSIGLRLAAPEEGWRQRPDMNPEWTRAFRASIVARARFVEDLAAGFAQYVILGAGLDTFAQRSGRRVFEVDRAETQAWKRQRLLELKLPLPIFVPVDFERESWLEKLSQHGFDRAQPALLASTGVSMYLTREAIAATLRQIAGLAAGTTLAMSFLLPTDLVEPELRAAYEGAARGAKAAGTPFVSFFAPDEIVALARECGFGKVEHVSADDLARRYFAGRPDGLRPTRGEELIVATA